MTPITIYRNTIKNVQGTFGSGLAALIFTDGTSVYADNGPLVRMLDAIFGNVIGPGHTIKRKGGYVGREVAWAYDDLGLTLGALVKYGDFVKETGLHIPKDGSIEYQPPADANDPYDDGNETGYNTSPDDKDFDELRRAYAEDASALLNEDDDPAADALLNHEVMAGNIILEDCEPTEKPVQLDEEGWNRWAAAHAGVDDDFDNWSDDTN